MAGCGADLLLPFVSRGVFIDAAAQSSQDQRYCQHSDSEEYEDNDIHLFFRQF